MHDVAYPQQTPTKSSAGMKQPKISGGETFALQ
jgi:hypothetical protein